MRAKMSDRQDREYDLRCNYFPDGHVGGMHDRAALALNEARAILAETEPPNFLYFLNVADMTQDERIILATSLGQWIGALGEGEGA